MGITKYLPLSYLSWCIGLLANMPLPQPLARWTILIFARAYGIDTSTATRPLKAFRSIGDFFTRDLRPEFRPIAAGVVCPVDGTLRNAQDLSADGAITQVKNRSYSLNSLLASDGSTSRFSHGQLWNFYLSPRDAHHIHSPVDGTIIRTIHIPGKLWPVNDWALNSIEGLFAVNERVVTVIDSPEGLVAVVMVGATNVGRISLSYSPLETNRRPWERKSVTAIDHVPALPIARGQKIGTFHMGSSVVVLTERKLFNLETLRAPGAVQYGESLGSLL